MNNTLSDDTRLHHPQLRQFYAQLINLVSGECDFTDAGVALYTSDASNYRQVPLGVVYPETVEDIVACSRLCREHGLAVLMRGGGTSQNGQCVNQAVILDCSRHLRTVHSIDPQSRTAIVDPGVVCDALKQAAEVHGLTFGPDPATHSRCTLGGMIGNNSCGPHSMLAGKTVENVVELEVLTASGDRFWVGPTDEIELQQIIAQDTPQGHIYQKLTEIRDQYANHIRNGFPTIKRRVSGFNLDQLLPENNFNVARALVGSEGTCVSVLRAKVRLIENPAYHRLVVLGFDDIYTAGDCVPQIMPFAPIAMEGLDWSIIGGLIERKLRLEEVAMLPEGKAWLLCELAADSAAELQAQCDRFAQAMTASDLVRSVRQFKDELSTQKVWSIREQGASATALSLNPEDPDPVVGWEDTAVDPLQLGEYLREFQALVDRYGYKTSLYGHFGDGCIHARITFDTRSNQGVAHWRNFSKEIASLVVKYGGSLSGEHGDGQAKAEFLPLMYSPELMQAFKQFKSAWDPDNRMNPGKLIDAYRMDENLRFGPDYVRPVCTTKLYFAEDMGDFGRSSERCIGMGKCRAEQGAMCPSYQVSHQERYSTRGRAHLLHELARGELIRDSWQNTDIHQSLEHCLSCKACKSECPTKVDIAAYKAEFMAQHYADKKRSPGQYILGSLGTLLPMLSRFSLIINPLQASPLAAAVKKIMGFSPEIQLSPLAPQSFANWAGKHCDTSDNHFLWFGEPSANAVYLWIDSFNANYRPHLLQSAIAVLCKAGFKVAVSRQTYCCGRPLYEQGMLEQAKHQLDQILSGFYPQLASGSQVVVLEASCLSVFHDEMLRLFNSDARAKDLCTRSMTVASFLSLNKIRPVQKLSAGLLHLHCHHKALEADATDRQWMKDCFESLSEPEPSCCGMAGSFGLRKTTRALAIALFKRKLGPAILAAGPDTVIVSNGFSCHEQLSKEAQVEVLHPVEVIQRCMQA